MNIRKRASVFFLGMTCLVACSTPQAMVKPKPTQALPKADEKKKNGVPEVSAIKMKDGNWMARDLRVTTFRNGEPISKCEDVYEAEKKRQEKVCERPSTMTVNGQTFKHCQTHVNINELKTPCYKVLGDDPAIDPILYNGYAVADERGLLPAGFELPTSSQFESLVQNWNEKNPPTSSASGEDSYNNERFFSESGFVGDEGGFFYPNLHTADGACAYWWTATDIGSDKKDSFAVGYCSQDLSVGTNSYELGYGFSVRGIRKNIVTKK